MRLFTFYTGLVWKEERLNPIFKVFGRGQLARYQVFHLVEGCNERLLEGANHENKKRRIEEAERLFQNEQTHVHVKRLGKVHFLLFAGRHSVSHKMVEARCG